MMVQYVSLRDVDSFWWQASRANDRRGIYRLRCSNWIFGPSSLIENKAGYDLFRRSALFSPTLQAQTLERIRGSPKTPSLPPLHATALNLRSVLSIPAASGEDGIGVGKTALIKLANPSRHFHWWGERIIEISALSALFNCFPSPDRLAAVGFWRFATF